MTTAVTESLRQALNSHQSGDLVKAEKIYRQVLQLHPSHSEALHLLGILEHQQDRNVAALDDIGQAIDLDDASPPYWNSLGTVYQSLGQVEKALAAFRRAIELAPRFADAYNNLGLVLSECGEPQGAEACFRQALQIDPNHAKACCNLAAALLAEDDIE